MTLETIKNKIAYLIELRREAHGNIEEQERINKKLDKLYQVKSVALTQLVI